MSSRKGESRSNTFLKGKIFYLYIYQQNNWVNPCQKVELWCKVDCCVWYWYWFVLVVREVMAVCSRRVVRVCSVCTVITVTLQPSHHTTTTLPVHYQSLSNHRDLSSSDNKWSSYTKHPLKVRLDPLKCIPLVSSQFWVSAALLYPHTSPGTLLMTRSHVNIHIKPPARDLHMIDCSLLLLSFLEARMTA